MRSTLSSVALRTSLLYALIAAVWILVSDKLVVAFFSDSHIIGQISMYKGWAFVAITALLLYLALRADLRRWEAEAADRKRAEAALAIEVDMRRALFAQSPDGVLIIDPETARPIEFNDAAHRQLGYSREEFARLSIFDLEAAETPEETRARIRAVLREGKCDFETRQRTRRGDIRNVHVTAQTIRIQGRDVYHCIWRDITERKRAEAALRESEERWRTVVAAEPECVKVLDREGRVVEMNPAGLEMIQATLEQVRGHCACGLVAGENQAAFNEMLAAVFRGETRHLVFDMIGLKGWVASASGPHQLLIEDFVDAVREDRPPRVSGRSALAVHALIDAMLASSAAGAPVAVGAATPAAGGR